MLTFLLVLLIIWAALAVIGFVVKGLLWLAIVGLVLFAGTAIYSWVKRKVKS